MSIFEFVIPVVTLVVLTAIVVLAVKEIRINKKVKILLKSLTVKYQESPALYIQDLISLETYKNKQKDIVLIKALDMLKKQKEFAELAQKKQNYKSDYTSLILISVLVLISAIVAVLLYMLTLIIPGLVFSWIFVALVVLVIAVVFIITAFVS